MQTVTEESLHAAVIVPARWPVREEDCGARRGRGEGGMEMARWGTSASKGPWVAVRASVGTVVLAALSSSAEVTRSPSRERRGEPEAGQPYQQPLSGVKLRDPGMNRDRTGSAA